MEGNDGPRGGGNGSTNQSVFLRGFKIAVKDDIFGLCVVEAVPRPKSPVVEMVPRPRSRGVVKSPCLSFLKWPSREKRISSPYTPESAKNSNANPANVAPLSQVDTPPVTFDAVTD